MKNGNGGTSVNDRIPKVDFWGGEIENGGDREGNQEEGLKVGE